MILIPKSKGTRILTLAVFLGGSRVLSLVFKKENMLILLFLFPSFPHGDKSPRGDRDLPCASLHSSPFFSLRTCLPLRPSLCEFNSSPSPSLPFLGGIEASKNRTSRKPFIAALWYWRTIFDAVFLLFLLLPPGRCTGVTGAR